MQQTFGLKRLVATHVSATIVALGVLVSSGLAMAGLTATGNMPWTSGSSAPIGAQQSAVQAQHTAQLARLYEVKLARQDALALQTSTPAARAATLATLRQFYAHKDQRQEAFEMRASALAAQAAQQETLRRFYAHKEERLGTLNGGRSRQHRAGLRRTRSRRCYRCFACHDADRRGSWLAPTPDGCSCPPAESWTLLDDLTPARTWQ